MRTLKEGFFGNIGIGKIAMIENWLKEYNIKNYTINDDYTIDVNDNVLLLYNKNITELPEYIQFGKIKGLFNISYNNITTLRGCPKEVDGNFYCCFCKNLTSLEGALEKVGGSFYCFECDNLKSLKGVPKEVGGHFNCSYCKNLTSLKDSPKIIYNNFYCNDCHNLKSLKGAPEKVGGDFHCSYCKNLKSLEGAPKSVKGDFYCSNCGNQFTKFEVETYSKVKGHIDI